MNEAIQAAIASGGTLPALILASLIVFIPLARARIYPAAPTALLFVAPCVTALSSPSRRKSLSSPSHLTSSYWLSWRPTCFHYPRLPSLRRSGRRTE